MATSDKQTKAERQATARERARQMQEEQRRREKRQSRMIRWGVVVGAIVVVAVVAGIIFMNTSRSIPDEGPAPSAGNVNGGVTLVSATELAPGDFEEGETVSAAEVPQAEVGQEPPETVPGAEARPEGEPAQVIYYADPNCVHCANFEQQYGGQLQEWLEAGDITMEYRLLNYLDSSANSNYSARASNAALCVSEEDPAQLKPFIEQMFAAYTGQGIDDDEMISMADGLGVDIASCVNDNTFRPFVDYTSAKAREAGIAGTPSVWVQGENWDGAENPDFVAWTQELIDNRQG